jgi:hypothetical protein
MQSLKSKDDELQATFNKIDQLEVRIFSVFKREKSLLIIFK